MILAANNLNFGGSNNGAAAGFGQLNPSTANLGLTGKGVSIRHIHTWFLAT